MIAQQNLSEPPVWPELEERIAALLGMRCDQSLRQRIVDAVEFRRKRLHLASTDHYLQRLRMADGRDEIEALAQHLTIGETYFFRGRDHYRAMAETVLPDLIRRNASTRRLRLLSAGCSSGEEPYSLAILLAEQFPELASWRIDIVGTDLNTAALAKAQRGIYTAWSLRDLPPEQVQRHFRVDGNSFELSADVRGRVRFEALNLMQDGPFWQQAPFDVVFCRNVLIYFTPGAIGAVLQRLQRLIARDGYLFMGHSESLRGFSQAFALCQSHDTFYYQLYDADAAPLPPPDDTFWADLPTPVRADAEPGFDDQAWMDAIRQTSERVARLSGHLDASPTTNAGLDVDRFASEPAANRLSSVHAGSVAASAGSGDAPESPDSLVETATDLFRRERYDEAIQHIRAQVDESLPRTADRGALLLLAAALLHQGRSAETERLCRRLLGLDECDADASYLLAACREQAGDLGGALSQLQAAIYLDAGFAMPQVLCARIERRRGERAKARLALQEAIRLLPQEAERRWLLFSGGFTRETLVQQCRSDLALCRA